MVDWAEYGSCRVCKQDPGKPCVDRRYLGRHKPIGTPHTMREMKDIMGAYDVTGVVTSGRERHFVPLAAHADMEEAEEIARSSSVVFTYEEVQVKQSVNGIIMRKYVKGEQQPV